MRHVQEKRPARPIITHIPHFMLAHTRLPPASTAASSPSRHHQQGPCELHKAGRTGQRFLRRTNHNTSFVSRLRSWFAAFLLGLAPTINSNRAGEMGCSTGAFLSDDVIGPMGFAVPGHAWAVRGRALGRERMGERTRTGRAGAWLGGCYRSPRALAPLVGLFCRGALLDRWLLCVLGRYFALPYIHIYIYRLMDNGPVVDGILDIKPMTIQTPC